MKKILLAATLAAAMTSGAYAAEYDPTDGVILPQHTTAAGVPVYTDGEIQPAVGVCCSDGVAQVSSVTIASVTPPRPTLPTGTPGIGGGGEDSDGGHTGQMGINESTGQMEYTDGFGGVSTTPDGFTDYDSGPSHGGGNDAMDALNGW